MPAETTLHYEPVIMMYNFTTTRALSINTRCSYNHSNIIVYLGYKNSKKFKFLKTKNYDTNEKNISLIAISSIYYRTKM